MDLVYGVCLKYLKDEDDAKDSVIQIFEELITKLQKHNVDHFKAWLYQLAKNHCLMRLRSKKQFIKAHIDPDIMQNAEMPHLNGALEKEENLKQLEFCLGKLNGEQKLTVELFYLQNKCYNEIAETTGIEWNAVRSAIQNGKRKLKLCMEKQKLQSQFND
jgi:RNA polymerase sigma-70 factor (ECF subfamily)